MASSNKDILYLCGHTQGGQICIKEGSLIISHKFEDKEFNQGQCETGMMKGYTSKGVGVSGTPVWFNCAAEVVLITLEVG